MISNHVRFDNIISHCIQNPRILCFKKIIGVVLFPDRGSITGRVIAKTQKMVLDAAWLSTQHDKVRIKGKVEQSREGSSALPYTSV